MNLINYVRQPRVIMVCIFRIFITAIIDGSQWNVKCKWFMHLLKVTGLTNNTFKFSILNWTAYSFTNESMFATYAIVIYTYIWRNLREDHKFSLLSQNWQLRYYAVSTFKLTRQERNDREGFTNGSAVKRHLDPDK